MKHMEKIERKKDKIHIIFLIIAIIIIAIAIGMIIIKTNTKDDFRNYISTETGNEPIIKYYDERKAENIEILEGKVINKKIIVKYDKGKAQISKNNGKFEDYKSQELSDGKYTIIVVGNDETVTRRNFEIDTLPPELIGIDKNEIFYEKAIKISLKDIEGTKVATITNDDNGTVVDLKEKISKRGDYYNITESGQYTIYLEDYYENWEKTTIYVVNEKEN